MKTTANFKLKKPDLTDVADIEVLNSNSDILDKIIKDLQNAQFTEQQARQIFALISHKHNTSDINNLTTAIQQTKVNSAAYADNANRLDNLDSTDFMRANKGDGTLANDLGVSKELRWKHYGQGHTIFDASNGTTPTGRACDRHNSENNYYSANCPNLMGWNGHQTYGLGVDRARTAEQVQGFQFRNNSGRLEVLVGGEWLPVGGKNYYINRTMALAQHLQAFEYSGSSGVIRGITAHHNTYFGNQDMINKFNAGTWTGHSFIVVWLDGVMMNNDMSAYSIQCDSGRYFLMGVEFKHSIKVQVFIRHTSGYFNVGVHIQTEK